MKGLLSPQKKTRVESSSSSPRRPGREPPLLPTAALSEALSVLVCDVEEHADDASRAMAGAGGGRKAQACMARARHSLEELKKQAKKAPRGEQSACEEVVKGLEARLEMIERGANEPEITAADQGGAAAGGARPVRKATAAALRHATDLQAGSEASIARSQQIVREAQETGTDTAILLKSQTEQLKSIYAEVSEMDDNIKRAKKIMKEFTRQIVTDKITACLLLLIVIAIAVAVVVKIVFKPEIQPWTPPWNPPPPKPLPPTPPPSTPIKPLPPTPAPTPPPSTMPEPIHGAPTKPLPPTPTPKPSPLSPAVPAPASSISSSTWPADAGPKQGKDELPPRFDSFETHVA